MAVEEVAAQKQLEEGPPAGARRRPFRLRYLGPKAGVALVLWRVEAYAATPLALLLIATLGRWPGALVMGSVMAVFAAVFLYLLEDDPVLDDVRGWAGRRRIGRALERLADRDDGAGKARRAVALVPGVMVLGPFWRAVAFHLFRMRRSAAYVLSVGGSFPHALLWVGLVLGSLWDVLIEPLLRAFWSDLVLPLIEGVWEALVSGVTSVV
jgi:hypothetical protein